MLGIKTKQKREKRRKELYWKRRIENTVTTWRKHLIKLECVRKGNLVLCENNEKEMVRKYELEAT